MSHEPVNSKDDPHKQAAELRRRAEEIFQERMAQLTDAHENLPQAKTRKILHDLQVHQIELEMQNEELRRAQTELGIAKDRYFEFFNLAPIGYITLSDKGLILEVNLTCTTLLGGARIDLVKQLISQFILPEDQNIFYSTRKNVFNTSEPQVCDLRMVKKDGTVFWACLTFTAAQDASGSPLHRIVLTDIDERKQAESAVRESEERLKFVLRGSQLGFWDWNLETNEVKRNDRWAEMLGYKLQEIDFTVKQWLDFIHPDDRSMAYQSVQDHLEGRTPMHQAEYRMLAKDGQPRWILDQAQVVKWDSHGRPLRMSGTHTDITERKQAEESLEETERVKSELLEKLNAAQQVAEVGSWEWDLQTNHVWWSDETYRIFGAKPQKFVPSFEANGKFIHPYDFERYVKSFDHSLQTGDPLNLDIRLYAADGQMKHCNAKGKVVYDDSGKQVRFVGTVMDITNRVQSEKEKHKLQTQLSNALAMAHLGHWEYDIASDLCTFNDHFYKIYQTTVEQVGGYTMPSAEYARRFVHPDDMALVGEEIRDAIETQDPNFSRHIEHRILYADGAVGYVSVRFFILKDDQGRTFKIYGVNQDITERKLAEVEKETLQAQLNQAQKMESVGRLAGGVAHDFNNMLSVIFGHTELALDNMAPNDPLYDDLKEILNAAQRSADITRQLLAFARKQTIAPKVIDLNETIEGMLKMLRRLIGENIDLAWLPGTVIWPVRMDPSQIDQIIANLCVNARDAIDGVGKLTIETGTATFDIAYCADHAGIAPGNYVLLTVSDDGCGMERQTLEKLFEPFFTTKDVGKGTGLGLATVYGIVKQNQGFINVYSEPGQGTTFRIYFPAHATVKTQAGPEQSASIPRAQGKETILLVEDEPTILQMTTRTLERLGYTVLAANSPGEALDLARQHAGGISLLMTDVVMPEMNGRDLAINIQSFYPSLRSLFMSGYTANVIAHHGVLDKGVQFLQKPFSKKDLAIALRQALKDEKSQQL